MKFTNIFATLVLVTLIACGAKKVPQTVPVSKPLAPVAVTSTPVKNAPAWIDNEVDPSGLVAVGMAGPNILGDRSEQRTDAIVDSRTKLAGKVKVRVQNMVTNLSHSIKSADGKNLTANEMEVVKNNVTRQLIDVSLNGANNRIFWLDNDSGIQYTQIFISNDNLKQSLNRVVTSSIAKGEFALNAQLDKMDEALDKPDTSQ